ncbi:hypothetical protein [Methylobacterium sp. CCH5-D2]|uniref:hypothetical protein n=1 Tax=Methylobacterium sp. CCH5-D2 TaxID=1768765 RepID=UPI000B00D4A9|nr:hypothetical protein [Methylobacterium sp. CCH5-D2]
MPVIRKGPGFGAIERRIAELGQIQIAIGIPAEASANVQASGTLVSAAGVGYLHETGAPEINLPPDFHLRRAIEGAHPEVAGHMVEAARRAVLGDAAGAEAEAHQASECVIRAVKAKIAEGQPLNSPGLPDLKSISDAYTFEIRHK